MDEELKQQLLAQGTQIESTIDRFLGNQEMYVNFLHKFTQDENFEGLRSSIQKSDARGAFHYAHTIKGVAANLGLESLLKPLNPLVEMLRRGELEGAAERLEEVDTQYQILCQIINSY